MEWSGGASGWGRWGRWDVGGSGFGRSNILNGYDRIDKCKRFVS